MNVTVVNPLPDVRINQQPLGFVSISFPESDIIPLGGRGINQNGSGNIVGEFSGRPFNPLEAGREIKNRN